MKNNSKMSYGHYNYVTVYVVLHRETLAYVRYGRETARFPSRDIAQKFLQTAGLDPKKYRVSQKLYIKHRRKVYKPYHHPPI